MPCVESPVGLKKSGLTPPVGPDPVGPVAALEAAEFTLDLSPWSYAYAGALTLMAAVIAGVVPALKITAGFRLGTRYPHCAAYPLRG